MTEFNVNDTVEITAPGAFNGEVGRVVLVVGPNVYVKTHGMSQAQPYATYELRSSQQKLIQPEAYDEG